MDQPSKPRLALLIDSENVPLTHVTPIVEELSKKFIVSPRLAFGSFAKQAPPAEAVKLAIELIQCPRLTVAGKNGSDIHLTTHALRLLYKSDTTAFAFVSSDSDLTPLVNEVIREGAIALVFGEEKITPDSLKLAATRFYKIKQSYQQPPTQPHQPNSTNRKRALLWLTKSLITAQNSLQNPFSSLPNIGVILRDLGNDIKSCGFKSLKQSFLFFPESFYLEDDSVKFTKKAYLGIRREKVGTSLYTDSHPVPPTATHKFAFSSSSSNQFRWNFELGQKAQLFFPFVELAHLHWSLPTPVQNLNQNSKFSYQRT